MTVDFAGFSLFRPKLYNACPMIRIHLDEQAATEKSWIALVAILQCNLRLMENWRELQLKGWGRIFDYESTLILIAIVVIGAEPFLAAPLEDDLHRLEVPMPVDRLRQCNLSSIAATTSLNRETVRRRVQQLEEEGIVVRANRGVRIAPGVMQRPEMLEAVQAQLALIARTSNDLLRQGIFIAGELTR
jgi:hypothetical protein